MSSRATSIAITRPSLPTSMPRTPVVSRPIARASDSAKRTVSPARETMIISSSGVDGADGQQLVVVADVDRDDPVGFDRRVVGLQLGLLDGAVAGREHEVLRLGEVARRDDRLDALALAQRQDVDERATLGGALRLGSS